MSEPADTLSTLERLVINDYASLAIVTVVIYDYILTFSREIDYVWRRTWTWVSTMFFVIRYVGFCWTVIGALLRTSFVSGPLEVNVGMILCYFIGIRDLIMKHTYPKGRGLFQVSFWTSIVFLLAADAVMILRVYAMWNRSRTILFGLLFIYTIQVINSVIFDGIYKDFTQYFSVTIAQVLDYSFCSDSFVSASPLHQVYATVPRLVLGVTLIILNIVQALKQSVEMYDATKQWKLNRYMQQLVREGTLYFIANMVCQTVCLLYVVGFSSNNSTPFVFTLLYVIFYIPVPRFVISIRELSDREVGGRVHIDTGFGMVSRDIDPNATLSPMAFRDVDLEEQGPKLEDDIDLDGLEVSRV